MIITGADVHVTGTGRNYVTLVVHTDEGIVGLGDATVNGRELAVASYLRDHLVPLLIGRDAFATEDTWQYLYRGAYWRRGPITMAAIAAVDVALWDIKAKAAEMPLYQLLGGASRNRLRAYGHAQGRDAEELLRSVRQRMDEGFTAVRVQVGVPGLEKSYGVVSDPGASSAYEPAQGFQRPDEELWDTERYLLHIPSVFAAVREHVGDDVALLHDVHHRLTPTEATRLARSLEPYHPFWIEDPTPAENAKLFRQLRQSTTAPIAIGEVFNTIWDYGPLLEERLIDYARSAVTHAGGLTAMKKLLDYAGVYNVRSGIHGPSDISPVGFAAALHLDTAIHNFGIQEYMGYPERVFELFSVGHFFQDGHLHVSDAPGLGVEFDVAAAEESEYRAAYLPVARLVDGTMHDW
ncbi:D-mannonate dehydratase ManD [Leifsonia sp. AG29]|uniref:D-mannonate dehydratase ManD n=1 Tax=Leifsonia sp. AG29 TaxID=2598860 RepID=UPI00131BB61D|nr:D-mannonate dehydratase ManD [Leifsonia sp. AG29]